MANIINIISAINKLSKPLREKISKKLGLSQKNLPGRKSDSIVVGKDRVKVEKKVNQLVGAGKLGGAGLAVYSVSDIINDLLGIKKLADATLSEADKRKARLGKAQAETTTTKTKKKSPPKIADKDLPKSRPKKKKDGVTFEFETIPKGKTKKMNKGGMGLKKIPDSNPGLKALKKQAPDVVKRMGYMKMGGMMKKKKTGNTDYRKGGAVGMMITISDNMKKKKGD